MLRFSGWWLNQPPWKNMSQNGKKNKIGVNIKKYLSCHHLVLFVFEIFQTKTNMFWKMWVPTFWLEPKKTQSLGLAPRFFVWSFLSLWFNKNPSTIIRRGLELLAKFILSSRKTNRSRMKDPQCQIKIPPRELTYPTLGRGKSSSNMPYQGDVNSLEGTSGYIHLQMVYFPLPS